MEFRIQFNGKNYGSVDEMAADERQRYEQAMKSIAPLLSDARVKESTHVWDGPAGIHTSVHTRIVVNDRTFKGPDELPPELKQQHDEAMRNLGAKASGGSRSRCRPITTRRAVMHRPPAILSRGRRRTRIPE